MTSSSWSPADARAFERLLHDDGAELGRRRAGEPALELALSGAHRGEDDDVVVWHCCLLKTEASLRVLSRVLRALGSPDFELCTNYHAFAAWLLALLATSCARNEATSTGVVRSPKPAS